MGKYFFRLILLIGSIVLLVAIFGSLLPRDYDFETSIEIDAPAARIYPVVNRLRDWPQWSRQFNHELEGLTLQYNEVESGPGAVQSWTDQRGDGKLWITDSVENQQVQYSVAFTNFPVMKSKISLVETALEEDPSKVTTRVTWSSEGSLPSGPFYGYFGSFFSIQMRGEYDRSLEKLKALVE